MSSVTFAGQFEPGTVVELWQVRDDRELTPANGWMIDKRLTDLSGTVGFANLERGARFIAQGFGPDGKPLELRTRSLEDGETTGFGQPPASPNRNMPVGTQESVEAAVPPAVPANMRESAPE